MVIYCVLDYMTRWRGYYSTLDRAKEVLWNLYIESGFYGEDKENPALMSSINNVFNRKLRIEDVGCIELISVED